jgi:5-methylthioadenosine/S-adenosylhomocysteine deaminase
MFQEILRLAGELGIGLHMHASENADWNVRGQEVHGLPTNVTIFKEFGLLGPKTTIAAMRVISDEDIANLAQTGSGLIHDPPAVLNRGTGLPPIAKTLSAGVKVGLGTNALGQDMFETMKTAGWVARTVDGNPQAIPVTLALEMGTVRNAQVLGMDNQVGSLEVGKKADIIIVDLNTSRHAPCLNVISALVSCTSGGDVADVILDGKLVIKDGKFSDLDEDSIIQEAYERAFSFAKRIGLDDRLYPLLGGTS